MIYIEQIKAARAMLGLSQKDLAKKAGIAIATLNNIERGAQKDPKVSTMKAIQHALEHEGIMFLNDEPLGSMGLILKQKRVSHERATILIVDDNKPDRTLYKSWLAMIPGQNYHIVEAQDAKEGLDKFLRHRPDCLILDFMMYGADGFQMLAALKQEHLKLPPIIFVTGMHNDMVEKNAKSQGVFAYLNKQKIRSEDLCNAVVQALEKS